jgi:hypothetical protein
MDSSAKRARQLDDTDDELLLGYEAEPSRDAGAAALGGEIDL